MTRFIHKKANWNKIALLTLTGTTFAAPIFTAAANAAPKGTYDERDRNNDGYNDRYNNDIDSSDVYTDNNRYNNGNGSNNGYINAAAVKATRTGVVTRDLQGDRFEIRTDNGKTFIVNLKGQNNVSFQNGSRVRVTGELTGDHIRRATVEVLNNNYNNGNYGNGNYNNGNYNNGNYNNGNYGNGNYNNGNGYGYGNGYNNGSNVGQRVTLRGVVTRDLNGRRFEMRQNNVLYYVVLTRNEPNRLSSGDRVEISGRLIKGNYIQADTLRILKDNNGNDWGFGNGVGNRINVDFSGRVLDVSNRRYLTVRGDNGTTYQVRTNFDFNNNISSGDRVRVVGTGFSGTRNVNASRVELRSDNYYNNGNGNYNNGSWRNGDRVDLKGTVRSVSKSFFGLGGATVVVDGVGGRTWKVRVSKASDWNRGDHIRARGVISNDTVTNAQIDRW